MKNSKLILVSLLSLFLVLACGNSVETSRYLYLGENEFFDLNLEAGGVQLMISSFDGSSERAYFGEAEEGQLVFKTTNQSEFFSELWLPTPDKDSRELKARFSAGSQEGEIPYTLLAYQEKKSTVEADRYDLDSSWPVFVGYQGVNSALTKEFKDFALARHQEFIAFTEEPDAVVVRELTWEQGLSYQIRMASREFLSLRYVCFYYTGGAHPNHWTRAFNYQIGSEGFKRLEFSDLITPGSAERILELVQEDLARQYATWPEEIGLEALENVTPTPAGLEFVFDPYQAGSYAEGTYTVLLPWSRLAGLVKDGLGR